MTPAYPESNIPATKHQILCQHEQRIKSASFPKNSSISNIFHIYSLGIGWRTAPSLRVAPQKFGRFTYLLVTGFKYWPWSSPASCFRVRLVLGFCNAGVAFAPEWNALGKILELPSAVGRLAPRTRSPSILLCFPVGISAAGASETELLMDTSVFGLFGSQSFTSSGRVRRHWSQWSQSQLKAPQ